MKEYNYLDVKNSYFDVTINDDNFISPAVIISISLDENIIIIDFQCYEYYEPTTLTNWKNKQPLKIDIEKIKNYFINKNHKIKLNLVNKQGIIYKTEIYYGCKYEDLIFNELENSCQIKLKLMNYE